jgi:hypothetical protein
VKRSTLVADTSVVDERQLAQLGDWARRLETRADDELRAASRAIVLLVDEVGRLRAVTRGAAADDEVAMPREDAEPVGEPPSEPKEGLRRRLRRTFGYGVES